MKIIITNILLLLSFLVIGQSEIYEVNTASMGVDSGSDLSLDIAINKAIEHVNATHEEAIIYLNLLDSDSDGKALIPISSMLTIDNDFGSITITKSPYTNIVQGLDGTLLTTPNAIGLFIDHAKNVTVKGLHFEHFEYSNAYPQKSIRVSFSEEIRIVDNNFFKNDLAVSIIDAVVTVTKCYFKDNFTTAIEYSDALGIELNQGIEKSIFIKNNLIEIPIPEFSDIGLTTNLDGISCIFRDINPNLTVYIDSNIVTGGHQSIQTKGHLKFGQQVKLLIRGNDLSNSFHGIALVGPNKHWIVENNVINDVRAGISLGGLIITPGNENDWTIDFIEENTQDLILNNTGNVITNCFESSFFSEIGLHNYIVGYDVGGAVRVTKGYPCSVMEMEIEHTGSFRPIRLNGSGTSVLDNLIEPTNAVYSDLNLLVDYNILETVPESSGDFRIEFYEANSSGDLVTYLGHEIKTYTDVISEGGEFTASFSGVILSLGDRIGVTITAQGNNTGGTVLGTSQVQYITMNNEEVGCVSCGRFSPTVGKDYWISAWVHLETLNPIKTFNKGTEGAGLDLGFFGSSTPVISFNPTGDIIDGWQRIVGKFNVPEGTTDLVLILNGDDEFLTYFDDIRIHPFNGSMKSYVYDGETFWLTSELDDNNYATFYEYDEEGGLVRIKKETAKGIVTIQETRSNTVKN